MPVIGRESYISYLRRLQPACIPDAISIFSWIGIEEFGLYGVKMHLEWERGAAENEPNQVGDPLQVKDRWWNWGSSSRGDEQSDACMTRIELAK